MSGCVVSNKLIWNRSLSCLSMLFLAATLMLVPEAEAQELGFDKAKADDLKIEAGVYSEKILPEASGGNGELTYSLGPASLLNELGSGI